MTKTMRSRGEKIRKADPGVRCGLPEPNWRLNLAKLLLIFSDSEHIEQFITPYKTY